MVTDIGKIYKILSPTFLGLIIQIDRVHYGRALKIAEEESEPEPLYMESFYLVFFIYLGGILVASLTFIYEIWINHKKRKSVIKRMKKTCSQLSQ